MPYSPGWRIGRRQKARKLPQGSTSGKVDPVGRSYVRPACSFALAEPAGHAGRLGVRHARDCAQETARAIAREPLTLVRTAWYFAYCRCSKMCS